MLIILTLIFMADEISTNAPSNVQADFIKEFWPQNGLSNWSILGMIAIFLMIPSFFYKSLADRYGRKLFLVLNTLGMGTAMLLCFYSPNLWVFSIAYIMMRWFVTPDEQVVYIFEIAPEKKRGTVASVTKGIAELGLFLVPLLRKYKMNGDGTLWRQVFLIPAIAGFLFAFLALFFARESDLFLDERISYLEKSDEEREKDAESARKLKTVQKTGFVNGLIYALKDKQIRWLVIATFLCTMATGAVNDYDSVMDAQGLASEISDNVMLIYPAGVTLITFIYGFFADKFGRKFVCSALLSSCITFYVLFFLGLKFNFNPYLTGIFLGLYLASFWCTGDTYIMMVGESAPTYLRASIMSAQSAFFGTGQGASMAIMAILSAVFAKEYTAYYCLAATIPAFTASLLVLSFKVKETKGADLTKIGEAVA
jgi:MFS family permease